MIWIRGSITFWFWQNYFAMSFFKYLIQVWLHNSGPWSIYNYSKCFIRSWRFKYNLTFVTCMYRYVILPTLIRLNYVTYCASSHSRLRFHAQTIHHKMCALRDSTVHGANMGPIWGRQDPDGPHVGPMDFVFWASTVLGFIVSANYTITMQLYMHPALHPLVSVWAVTRDVYNTSYGWCKYEGKLCCYFTEWYWSCKFGTSLWSEVSQSI